MPEEAPPPRPHSIFDASPSAVRSLLRNLRPARHNLPLYPLIMLAIYLEDGRPFFFAHKRETRGGREFGCVKFRSMRKDAEKMKALLKKTNQADGPQFFMENDPRLTRCGKFLRKYNLDELPQFWNVLTGDMSVVGPSAQPPQGKPILPPLARSPLERTTRHHRSLASQTHPPSRLRFPGMDSLRSGIRRKTKPVDGPLDHLGNHRQHSRQSFQILS